MALWFFVVLILLSASFVLYLSFGPLKKAPNVSSLRVIAGVQYFAALLLVFARVFGRA
ncbi:hypothetical protein Q0M94_14105 [Deinococcus radiomollis]|uniref:hypothetical protein n=1 Tax=Deinococcus radiomollis TaxID=468916 RepID=UPI0038911E13